jgi:hypothetical protein
MPVLEVFCALSREAGEQARKALSSRVSHGAIASDGSPLPAAS